MTDIVDKLRNDQSGERQYHREARATLGGLLDEAADEITRLRAENEWLTKRVEAADGLLAIMLANIDHAMSATHETPAVFKVTTVELGSWADAVETYETARFPNVHEASDD